LDEKSGETMMMQTSRRIRGKVVARKERLKTSFATYLGPAMRRINTKRLAGQTDEYQIGLLLDWWNWVSSTTKCMEWSTTNQKHESKSATRRNHDEHQLNKAADKRKLQL
jgi:hypothetical protein